MPHARMQHTSHRHMRLAWYIEPPAGSLIAGSPHPRRPPSLFLPLFPVYRSPLICPSTPNPSRACLNPPPHSHSTKRAPTLSFPPRCTPTSHHVPVGLHVSPCEDRREEGGVQNGSGVRLGPGVGIVDSCQRDQAGPHHNGVLPGHRLVAVNDATVPAGGVHVRVGVRLGVRLGVGCGFVGCWVGGGEVRGV